MPKISFPADLPVSARVEDIAQAMRDHQVVIVAGETGSGKTTQLPKIALQLGAQRIAHTQPRRIAARSVAERIAEELGTEVGDVVGYQVRFTDRVSPDTRVRVMTDGILLNQVHRDRLLSEYDTIIIDEAHERSLNIDFLLGILRTILPQRPDLRVIITSATIDPESFAKHFADAMGEPAPVIEVSGRTFPVEIRYRPLLEEGDGDGGLDLYEGVRRAVAECCAEGPGDVLVFVSGEAEIRDLSDLLGGKSGSPRGFDVLPLYGRLSAQEQHRVFRREGGTRRVIVSTNVAETSLTVPGIVYVVDAGTARISRWSARSKVQRLPIEPISQASAGQRAGRAGRTQAGVVIRLYSEEDFLSRPEYTDPEIVRTGLAQVILQMMVLRLGHITEFPFLTPPDRRGIRDGLDLLAELGAIRQSRVTRTGRAIARLPIEPRFARMIVESVRLGVADEVTAIVAGLTVQDVRERPEEFRAQADQLHARFTDPQGDLMTLLNLWKYVREQQQKLSASAFRRLCRAEFLHYLRIREWMDLVRQLERARSSLPKQAGSERPVSMPDAEAVHRSILSGLLSRLGVRDDTQKRQRRGTRRLAPQEYLGSRGTRFVLFPGSVLAKKPPEVVMSVELVETSRLFARGNAVVNPEWAEELAGPLVKRQVSDPRWEKSQGAAIATERVTLFGVPIVSGRRVQYASVDREHARELFIRHALVEGEWDSPQTFDRANWQLRKQLEQLEERSRRRDLIVDDDVIYDFYDARIPKDVVSTRSFEGWWKRVRTTKPKLLHLREEDLLLERPDTSEQDFPRMWSFGDQSLKLRYKFDPTAHDDGVTLTVPLPLLPRLSDDAFSDLVPGLRQELVAALIKTLPKSIRKHVVPANDWAQRLLKEVSGDLDRDGAPSLTILLAQAIRRHTSQPVTADDFDTQKLPAHLVPTFQVIDARGKTVAKGKNIATLQQQLKDTATGTVADVVKRVQPGKLSSEIEQTGLTSWSFGDLPRHVDVKYDARGSSGVVRAYPALIDRRSHVDIKLVADAAEQQRLSRRGVRRLVMLSSPSPVSYIRDHLSNEEKLLLGAGPYPTLDAAVNDVALATSEQIICASHPDGLVWDADAFERLANAYARELIDNIYRGIALTTRVLAGARDARKAIEAATSLSTLSQVKDGQAQLSALVFDGFVSHTGLTRLERVPVYLQALSKRMGDLTANVARDRTRQNEVDRVVRAYQEAGGVFPAPPNQSAALRRVRWLIEEFRVSVFAQELGTQESVSVKRILKEVRELPPA